MKSFIVLLLSFFPLLIFAESYHSAVSTSTGGSGRAAIDPGDVSFLNPATLAHLRGYFVYTGHASGQTVVGLSDNTPDSVLPAAFAYSKFNQTQDVRLSFADFISPTWTIGVTGHYFSLREEERSYNQFNADIGIAYVPRWNLGFGLVFYNVVGEAKNFPEAYRIKPEIGLGFNYIYRKFLRWRLDLVGSQANNYTLPSVMGGMESYMNKWMLLRLGYRLENSTDSSFATTGLGLELPRFRFNYAYEGDTRVVSNSRHSIDLSIPF